MFIWSHSTSKSIREQRWEGIKWRAGESSKEFVCTNIFRNSTGLKKAVGFKLFYFHARQDPISADVWDYLSQDRDVRVIFLNRRNLLNKYLSDLRAQKSGVWHPLSDDYLQSAYRNVIDIEVPVRSLMRAMTDLYCGYHRMAEVFREHKNIHLYFEDLEAQGDQALLDVYRFLDLEPQPVVDPVSTWNVVERNRKGC